MTQRTPLNSYDILLLSITLLVLVTLSFQLSIAPNDYWWCLRVGHETLANGAVPATDTYSWTQYGKPIVYQPWLACVALWLTYDAGSALLSYIVRGLLIALAYGMLWYLARQESGPHVASVLIILMGFATCGNWMMRTQLFAYPLFAACLYCLYRWQQGNNRLLWILPVATLLWSNLHGSFILVLVLAGTAFVFGKGDRKSLFITGVLMLLATLVTPYTLNTWRQVVFMLGNPSDQLFSVEWFPPTNEGWQANIFFGWVLVMGPLVALSERKFSLMEWVLFLGFGWLALSGVRYIIWFMFILAILTARLVDSATKHKLDPAIKVNSPVMNYILAGLFLLLPALSLPGFRENWLPEPPPVYSTSTAIDAVKWLQEHPDLPGPLWNDFAIGSYIIYALPARPPWLDPRFFVYPPEQMETYQKINHALYDWEDLLQKDGVNLLLLSVENQENLIEAVGKSDQWCEQYRDTFAVIFSRCVPIP